MSRLISRITVALLILLLALVPACFSDQGVSNPEFDGEAFQDPADSAAAALEGWSVECQVDIEAGSFTCGDNSPESPEGDEVAGIVVGGQNQYVTLANDPVETNGDILTANVWVQNLLPQPIGTLDGTTPTGIRVFFHSGPTNGVTVRNPDGHETFTATQQPFFQYARMAETEDRTVRKEWQFDLNGQTAFSFQVYVDADVPHPDGWVEVTPSSEGLALREELALTAQAYDVVGRPVTRSYTWTSSNDDVVSVDASGNVTAGANGTATITAIPDGEESPGLASLGVGELDIAVELTVSPDPVRQGVPLTYSVTVTNNGPSAVTGITRVYLTIRGAVEALELPSGCNYDTSHNEVYPGEHLFFCDIDSLLDGQSHSFDILVRPVLVESLSGEARLRCVNGSCDFPPPDDSNPDNNRVQNVTVVEELLDVDLELALEGAPGLVVAGEVLDYTITATNPGPVDAVDAEIELRIDSNGDAEVAGAPSSCVPSTLTDGDIQFNCSVASIGAEGSETTASLSIRPGPGLVAVSPLPATGSLVSVRGLNDPIVANNTAVESTDISPASSGLSVSPASFDFPTLEEYSADPQQLTITNGGSLTSNWSLVPASGDASWIVPDVASGELAPGESVVVMLGTSSARSPGSYSGVLEIVEEGFIGSPTVNVGLAVEPITDAERFLIDYSSIADALTWEDQTEGYSSYPDWSTARRLRFHEVVVGVLDGSLDLPEVPANQIAAELGDSEFATTVLSPTDAFGLFMANVAHSLIAETRGQLPWSLAGYSAAELDLLFDSRAIFFFGTEKGYLGYELWDGLTPYLGFGVLAPPSLIEDFLSQNDLIGATRRETIARVLDWSRSHMVHFAHSLDAANAEAHWQYRGAPPVPRVISGTTRTLNEGQGFGHWTAGCHGTAWFLHLVLRVVNIPVDRPFVTTPGAHATPHFPTEGLYLSHGDDPYSPGGKSTPDFPETIPTAEYLIDDATYSDWFSQSLPVETRDENIGRQVRVLAKQYLSQHLLNQHCDDLATGTPPESSRVLQYLRNWTLEELQAENLWERLDSKVNFLGGCSSIPRV